MADEQPPAEGNQAPAGATPANVTWTSTTGAPIVLSGAENPDAVKNALKEERKAAKDAAKRAEVAEAKLAEREEADKTDAEKALGKVESLTSERNDAKAENLRLRVALEKKLPTELIDRLKGSSKEEIEADADALLKLVHQPEPPSFDGGVREPAPESKSPEEGHRDLLLRAFGRTPT